MALFEIWNPHLVAPQTLRVDLTEAEASFTHTGSEALLAAVAAALDVGELASWQRRPVRTQYYSWYRDEDEAWVDRWPVAWQLTLHLRAERPVAPIPRIGRFALDEIAASPPDVAPVSEANLPCVALAAFRERAAADAALAPGLRIERGTAMGRFPSLAIDLGPRDDGFYERGAREAESLLAQLAALGGTVNQRDTFLWFARRDA